MATRQLEIRFENGPEEEVTPRRERRVLRAQWWFSRMKGVVAAAPEYKPPGSPSAQGGSH